MLEAVPAEVPAEDEGFKATALQIVESMDEPGFHLSTAAQLRTVASIAEALRTAYLKGVAEGTTLWDPNFEPPESFS